MKIRTLSIKQAQDADRRATAEYGIPSLLLMENAGIGLARQIQNMLIAPINICRVVMICGIGNNGGDAFVAARHLLRQDIRPDVFVLGDPAKMKEEAAVNYRIIQKLGIRCESADRFQERQKEWGRVPVVIVDALLGIGFVPPVRPPVADMIAQIKNFKKNYIVTVKTVAVDIPSGLHGDDGVVGPEVVQADMTVTFASIKQGLKKPEARGCVGRIEVVDIGIPDALTQEVV